MGTIEELPERGSAFLNDDYQNVLERLNQVSIKKYYSAYLDIDWDNPDMQVHTQPERWLLPPHDPLGGTHWYQNLSKQTQIDLALERTALRVKIGIVFENIVVRGLMSFALQLPNRSSEFRYALHEAIEETQHSLMFQEFVNRSGFDPNVISPAIKLFMWYVLRCAANFPELFFIFVLAGEEPIDFEQRQQLKLQKTLHPLMAKINKIHITEEARHICFAGQYLKHHAPKLSGWKRFKLRLIAPFIMGTMGKLFLEPPESLIAKYEIPKDIVNAVYNNDDRKVELREATDKIVSLCRELGLITHWNIWLWRHFSLIS